MNDNLPAGRSTTEVEADPIANPGLPAHVWRPTDVDPRAEKRAERQVALMFGLSALCTIGSSSPTSPSASVRAATPSWASARPRWRSDSS